MNPIITHKFTADPTVLVHNGSVYLYTGHDEAPPGVEEYIMNEWLCFSSSDLMHWEEHDINFKATDFNWARGDAFATKIIALAGKFYWYTAVTHASIAGKAIGVAVADDPAGPFKDARGSALIDAAMIPSSEAATANMDPTVLIDDDGQSYIFWGKGQCYYAKLRPNMIELDSPIKRVHLPDFAEGAHIHKREKWYYLSYGYGMPEKVAYAMSRNINGPWEFKGILSELAGNCETNRAAIINFKDKDYYFYHNGGLKGGGSHRRSVCVDRLYYNPDGTMKSVEMTTEGIGRELPVKGQI